MARNNKIQIVFVFVQRIVEVVHVGAGNAEHSVDTVSQQRLDDSLSGRKGCHENRFTVLIRTGDYTKSYQISGEPDLPDAESLMDNALVFGVLFEMSASNQ
jgi:hypothetical protein